MGGAIIRRPAVPSPVRTRRDISKLSATDPIVDFYRQAIGLMKTRPLNQFNSWRYQSAIHDFPNNEGNTANLPPDLGTFWRKCQHSSWFFLSWHRMYLHHFEKIVMNDVVSLGGPADWAIPYWNYSASATAALLPAPFRNEFMPDGRTPNDLFVRERTAAANTGGSFLSAGDTSLECLRAKPFPNSGLPGALPNFGGPTVLSHPISTEAGALENAPHNAVHGQLGGSNGFMTFPTTAPLDPMFWLHHSNIDRLWEVWVQRQKHLGNLDRNPKGGNWLDVEFDFRDATNTPVKMKSRDVLNTRIPPLSYEYEDTSDPFNGAP